MTDLHTPLAELSGDKRKPQVFYAAGWRPEPYKPDEKSWADDSKHVKISDYSVIRNDADAYSWLIQEWVTDQSYELAWKMEPEELTEGALKVTIENGCLVLMKEGAEKGAYLKLPKAADTSFTPIVDTPPRGGLFVTVGKTGAKAPPKPLSPEILGTAPIVQKDRAPPLDEDLARVASYQPDWAMGPRLGRMTAKEYVSSY